MVRRICWVSRLGEDGGVAVSAHAAGVRALVAIEDGFVILRGRERDDVAAVAERDEADFFAAQEFLDHQAALELAERGFGFGAVLRDDDAFSGGEAVGFEDYRKAEAVERGARFGFVFGGGEAGGGDSTLREKALCENFAAFEARGVAVGSDDQFAFSAELIDDAVDQRSFGSDDGQIGADVFGDFAGTTAASGMQVADARHARIAGGREDFDVRAIAPVSNTAHARARRFRGPESSLSLQS